MSIKTAKSTKWGKILGQKNQNPTNRKSLENKKTPDKFDMVRSYQVAKTGL